MLQKSSWNFLQTKREREREREEKKRKTRGYVSRCPNFIHSHPFVCFSSVSVHPSCIRSFVLFIRSVFVCLFVEEASYFCVMVFCHSHGVKLGLGKKLVFSVCGVSQHTRIVCAFCFSAKIKSPPHKGDSFKKIGHLCFVNIVRSYVLQSHLHCFFFF